jgi:hypothetical protein
MLIAIATAVVFVVGCIGLFLVFRKGSEPTAKQSRPPLPSSLPTSPPPPRTNYSKQPLPAKKNVDDDGILTSVMSAFALDSLQDTSSYDGGSDGGSCDGGCSCD